MNRLEKRTKQRLLRANIDSIPEAQGGVYAVWTDYGKCIYVGMSENSISRRLMDIWVRGPHHNEHLRCWVEAFRGALCFCYLPMYKGQQGIKRMESRLIKRWKPETNISENT